MRYDLVLCILLFFHFPYLKGQADPGPLPNEELSIHTDRNFFIAGDNLFYKLYLKSHHTVSSRFAYLIIRDEKSAVVTHSRLEIQDGIAYGSLRLADTLKTGMYQLLCYTNYMRNRPETVFKKEIIIANRFDDEVTYFTGSNQSTSNKVSEIHLTDSILPGNNLNILTNKNSFATREKISFTIDPGTMSDDEISSLSVSVSRDPGYLPQTTSADILSRGRDGLSQEQDSDNLMFYEMESDRSVIQGVVSDRLKTINPGNNYPVPLKNNTIFVSASDSVPNLQFTQTDPSGKFSIYLDPYYEGKEIFLKLRRKADAEITIDSKYEIKETFRPALDFDRAKVREFIKEAVKTGQISRYYGPETKPDTIITFNKLHYVPAVYYKPYPRIWPADYIELKDLLEISREIIPALRIRNNEGSYVASYPSLQNQVLSDEEPLVFLDGVPIDNVSQIITLGSNDIRYIETVPEVRYFNGIYFNGILNVSSRNNAIRSISFSQPFRQLEPEESISYTRMKHFDPLLLPSHYPDLRYVLFWEPDFKPNEGKMDFDLWTSDIQGEYLIDVQGITKKGVFLTGSAVITVKAR